MARKPSPEALGAAVAALRGVGGHEDVAGWLEAHAARQPNPGREAVVHVWTPPTPESLTEPGWSPIFLRDERTGLRDHLYGWERPAVSGRLLVTVDGKVFGWSLWPEGAGVALDCGAAVTAPIAARAAERMAARLRFRLLAVAG